MISCAIDLLYPLGLRFWKVGSRKIYAIKKSAHARQGGKSRKHQPQETSASDSEEDFIPARKQTVTSGLASLTKEVTLMRKELQHLFKINRLTKIPVALHRKLSDTFKCNICQSPITPRHICTLLQEYSGLQQLCGCLVWGRRWDVQVLPPLSHTACPA